MRELGSKKSRKSSTGSTLRSMGPFPGSAISPWTRATPMREGAPVSAICSTRGGPPTKRWSLVEISADPSRGVRTAGRWRPVAAARVAVWRRPRLTDALDAVDGGRRLLDFGRRLGPRLRFASVPGACRRAASRPRTPLVEPNGACPLAPALRYVVSPLLARRLGDCTTATPAHQFIDASAQPSRRRQARTAPTGPSARGACRTGRTWHSSARRCSPRRGPAPSLRRRAARSSARSPTS